MLGKMGLLGVVFIMAVAALTLFALPYTARSAEYQTGSTTMNVTIRGYVSITASTCLTGGITFSTQDPGTNDNNASCNSVGGASGYNITIASETTVNVNFTHATNRTNLTAGSTYLDIGNLTTNSNSTANNGGNLLDPSGSAALSMSWLEMETCGTLAANANCWSTYFLDVPTAQPPGVYRIGYCWCGRQESTSEGNCGTCT